MADKNKYNYSPEARKARLEYNRAYHEKWRAEHPDYDKNHREANREQYQEAGRKYKARKRQEDPQHFAKKLKQFRQDNPEKQPEYTRRMWEKRADKVSVTKAEVTVTSEPGQKVCINCGGFYRPIRSTAKYCSDNCRVNYNRRR